MRQEIQIIVLADPRLDLVDVVLWMQVLSTNLDYVLV